MAVQHAFNLRVGDLNYIPVEEFEKNDALKTCAEEAVSALENDSLLDVLINNKSEIRGILVKTKDGDIKGIITPNILLKSFAYCYKKLLAFFDAVLKTMDEAVTAVDAEKKVVVWNQSAAGMYKVSDDEILGSSIESHFTNVMLSKAMGDGEDIYSHYHQPRDGTHVLINTAPIYIDSQLIGGVSCERNITDIVRLNNELSKASSEVNLLKNEIRKISDSSSAFDKLIGRSQQIKELRKIGKKVAGTNASVLVQGESGTGKELFARALHLESLRRSGPFITVNCGAIPASLFESELFGYAPGAFAGAEAKGKPGMFELANGGTVFLDEVGELPPDIQVKLIRVLQDKVFCRVGSSEPVKADVRVIAATHRNLESMMANNQFREDLYYSLNVVSVKMPPLRERKEDIPELMHFFLQEFSQTYGKVIAKVEPEVTNIMLDYNWPGNLRELKNVVERMVVLLEGEVITKECLPENLNRHTYISLVSAPNQEKLINVAVEAERQVILKTLEQCGGNRSEAARLLGIPRSTLYYKLRQLGIRHRAYHSNTGGEKINN